MDWQEVTMTRDGGGDNTQRISSSDARPTWCTQRIGRQRHATEIVNLQILSCLPGQRSPQYNKALSASKLLNLKGLLSCCKAYTQHSMQVLLQGSEVSATSPIRTHHRTSRQADAQLSVMFLLVPVHINCRFSAYADELDYHVITYTNASLFLDFVICF